jgi:peptide/nickel transport system permease protein
MLPTLVPELIVLGTFDIGVIITLEASLSYLGLGVQPPTPSWGGMIADGQQFLQTNPMLCIIPAAAVFLLVGGIAILSQHFTARLGRLDGATLRSNVK